MIEYCGTGPEGFYCFAPAGHEGDHDHAGAVLQPREPRASPAAARRARRRALVARVGSDAASGAVKAGRAPSRKGSAGEVEVRDLWRAAGWTDAGRSPGSGSRRPWGARDVSPWPGDLIGTGGWIVEVKRNEAAADPGRTWVGEAFVRATCRTLRSLVLRHRSGTLGAAPIDGCAWIRASRTRWTVWVPAEVLDPRVGRRYDTSPAWGGDWIGITPELFFAIAGPPAVRGGR